MTAQQLLANYYVSIAQAYQFIIDNLSKPQTIMDTSKKFGITNDMLAEIVSSQTSGITGSVVKSFFAANGINSAALDDNQAPTGVISLSNKALMQGQSAKVSIDFSEAVMGLSLSDFSVDKGVISELTSTDNIHWIATFTPDDNTNSLTNIIKINQNQLTDFNDNKNLLISSDPFLIDTTSETSLSNYVYDRTNWNWNGENWVWNGNEYWNESISSTQITNGVWFGSGVHVVGQMTINNGVVHIG